MPILHARHQPRANYARARRQGRKNQGKDMEGSFVCARRFPTGEVEIWSEIHQIPCSRHRGMPHRLPFQSIARKTVVRASSKRTPLGLNFIVFNS